MKTVFIVLLISLPLAAQDPQLSALHDTIMSMRAHPNDFRETRGATAQLTVAKHQFRDWIESLMKSLGENDDEASLGDKIHAGIRDSKLFCEDFNIECYPSNRGFLDEVQITRDNGFLIVRTAVGIWCGYDYSAYIYKWKAGGWQRIWVNEQTTYTVKGYRPQTLHAVQISEPDDKGNRLLMTLGSQPGCASGFQPIYYRVWPMNAKDEILKPILDGNEVVNVGSDPPVEGQVKADDIILEFTAGGTAYGDSHKAVRHFEVRGGPVQQVDPIAPTPRDFVEEWLASTWAHAATRAESPSLKEWHTKLHRDDMMGDYPDPALHCSSSAELWQVGTHLHEGPKTFYLVRWKEPYRFTMAGISDKPYPDCNMPDPKGDNHPALFDR